MAKQGLNVQRAPMPGPAQCPCLEPPKALVSPSQDLLNSVSTLVTK